MEIGYKVLTREWRSCLASCSVQYGFFWATPKLGNGPLAVFEKYTDAVFFINYVDVWKFCCLHKCIYIPEDRIDCLWDYFGKFKGLPQGTKLARAVHLID